MSGLNMDEAASPFGPDSEAYYRAAARRLPLADFECRHGRLPHDPSEPCGCWPAEARRPILRAPLTPAELAADLTARLPKEARARC